MHKAMKNSIKQHVIPGKEIRKYVIKWKIEKITYPFHLGSDRFAKI